jgi:hypothetical protein
MATFFRNKVINGLGTTPTTIADSTQTSRITIIGLSICNVTDHVVKASVQLADSSSSQGYYIKDVVVPVGQSLRVVNGGEKLVLAESNILTASCDTEGGVDVISSYVEIV